MRRFPGGNTHIRQAAGKYLFGNAASPLQFHVTLPGLAELGVIDIEPQEIAVIPRGLVYRVEVLDGPCRGFVCENYGQKFELPGGWSTLPIELSVLMVQGQVWVGDEPVAAKVTLSRPKGKSSVAFESDATALRLPSMPSKRDTLLVTL